MTPPPGYEEVRRPDLLAWAKAGLADAAISATDPALGHASRGAVMFRAIEADAGTTGGNARVAVRHYFRGGLLGALVTDLQADAQRPLREILLFEAARAAGVPTLEPLAGVSRRAAGPFWRCDLVTREVPDAVDLGALFVSKEPLPPPRRALVIARAAESIRAFHDAGFHHVDLNLKNVLVARARAGADGEVRALVIDLDGAVRGDGPLEDAARTRNLHRLYRSALKLAQRHGGAPPSARDMIAFARAYAGRDRARLRALARAPLPGFHFRRLVLWRGAASRT